MKLNLTYPFTTKYTKGYLVTNKENRKMVCLYNNHKDRTTISYARYLVSVKEKRFLNEDEHVDHIDNNKTNDDIQNLQILTPLENHNKTFKTGETLIDFICPVCNKNFSLTKRQSHKINPTCSKKCGGIKSHWKK